MIDSKLSSDTAGCFDYRTYFRQLLMRRSLAPCYFMESKLNQNRTLTRNGTHFDCFALATRVPLLDFVRFGCALRG